jgi:hypothetical protein
MELELDSMQQASKAIEEEKKDVYINTIVLKALEYMLHKRIAKKKLEIHKYRERAKTDKRLKH